MRAAKRFRVLLFSGLVAGVCLGVPWPGAAGGAAAGPVDAAAEGAAGARSDSTTGGAAETPAWLSEVTLDAFLSSSYSYNFNRPASLTNQYRVFDFDDNTFKLDVFELVAQKPAAKPRDSGFRVDLTLGGSIPRVTASAGLFRDASGVAQDVDIHQAFVSYVAPLGSGLKVDAGKFITGHGYEVIDGYDGWNDTATRSFLFGYAIPFTHVGVRASYAVSSRATLMAMVVNGWDVARDNNKSKSLGGQLALTPTSALTLYASGMWGPERAGDDFHARSLLDVVAVLKAASRLTLGANADWGIEDYEPRPGESSTGPPTRHWTGAAGYARAAVTQSFALILRGEFFDDQDGLRTGTAQELTELTVTPELRLTPHLLVRGDVRFDRSDRRVFEKGTGLAKTQRSVLAAAIYSF